MSHRNDPAVIRRLLTTPARWAVVGLSQNRARAAHGVSAYLHKSVSRGDLVAAIRAAVREGERQVTVTVTRPVAGAIFSSAVAIHALAVAFARPQYKRERAVEAMLSQKGQSTETRGGPGDSVKLFPCVRGRASRYDRLH